MILVFDTNVFLGAPGQWELLEHLPRGETTPEFFVAMNKAIEDEYIQYAQLAGPESPLRAAAERILDGKNWFVIPAAPEPSPALLNRIRNYVRPDSIEPQLFGAAEERERTLVYANDQEGMAIPREYPRNLCQIQADGGGPDVRSLTEILKILRDSLRRAPSSLADIESILQNSLGVGGQRIEDSWLEFKCPTGAYLTSEMREDTVEAICAMLNTGSGWVFLGIKDDGEIMPFPPRYGRRSKPPNVDLLLRDILAEVDKIIPRPGALIDVWPVPDSSYQNYVVVIHIQKGSRDYTYKGEKWIRSGPRTIADDPSPSG